MAITTEDIVRTLKDPTPLYALAGTADLAAEKLKEVPPLIEKLRAEAPERIEKVRGTDPKAVQEKVTTQAKDAQARAQAKVGGVLGAIELDARKLRDSAQEFALHQIGRAAEYAVKARETYDELAERGKGAVKTWRGEAAEQVEGVAAVIESGSAATAPEDKPGAAAPAKKAPAKKTTVTTGAAPAKKPAAKPGA
jgi:heparin binding hemagglutinin HbhA